MKVGIRTKLFGAFVVMLGFLVVLGGISIAHIVKTNQMLSDIKKNEEIMVGYNDIAFHTVRSNAAIRGYMNYKKDFMKENHFSIRKEVHASIDRLKELGVTNAEFVQFEKDFVAWEQAIDEQVMPLIDANKLPEALKVSAPILGEGSQKLVVFSKDNAKKIDKQIVSEIEQMNASGDFIFILTTIVVVVSLIVGAVLAFVFGNGVSRAIQQIISQVKQFASGDFTVTFNTKLRDEFGMLASSMNEMTSTLGNTLNQISSSAEQVAATAEQLTASSQEVSKATVDIGGAIQNISSGIEKQNDKTQHTGQQVNSVAHETDQISAKIQSVNEQTDLATEKANQGRDFANNVTAQMDTILTKTNQITTSLHELKAKSTTITEMVAIISNIAEQTNLLALNASIEAARAGEHGKGFAVVASEVRKLAEQSGNAAQEIHTLVDTITAHTDQVVQEMDSNNASVQKGKEMVDVTGATFADISQAVERVQAEANDVTTAIHNMHENIQSIVQDTNSIVSISGEFTDESQTVAAAIQEESAMMEEVAAAANELAHMAIELQESVSQFKY
nr:methyl-accepting chemotaxis protein [Bacillus sp. FJAT-42315]